MAKAGETVILATLKRGKNYKHLWEGKYEEFKQRVPRPVPEGLADELEDLVDLVGADDGQKIEMDRFDIDRDASLPDPDDAPRRVRLRLRAEEVPVRSTRRAPAVKAPPPRFKRNTG